MAMETLEVAMEMLEVKSHELGTPGTKVLEMNGTKDDRAEQSDGLIRSLIPGLPDEVAILCLVRVSRSCHHNMRGVCRSWRGLIHGAFYHDLRRELSLTEEWLCFWKQSVSPESLSCKEMDAFQDDWYEFDPVSEKWFRLPKMPLELHRERVSGQSGLASLDAKLYVIGGKAPRYNGGDDHQAIRTVCFFDMRSRRWGRAADLNEARASCITAVIDNRLYAVGGWQSGAGYQASLTSAEVYDPVLDTWQMISSMESSISMTDGVVMGEEFYVIEHLTHTFEPCWGTVYNARTDEWKPMKWGLVGTWGQGWGERTAVLNGRLYTVHGSNYVSMSDSKINLRIHVYNPSTNVWEPVAGWDDLADERWNVAQPGCLTEVELVSFRGNLCIFAIQDDDLTGHLSYKIRQLRGDPGYQMYNLCENELKLHISAGLERALEVNVASLEIKETTYDRINSMPYVDQIGAKIRFQSLGTPPSYHLKRCHVTAL